MSNDGGERKEVDAYDKLLAFLREMWRHLAEPTFSPLDLLILLALLAAHVRHVPGLLVGVGYFLWLLIRWRNR